MADAADLKSAEGNLVWVRIPPALPGPNCPNYIMGLDDNAAQVLSLMQFEHRDKLIGRIAEELRDALQVVTVGIDPKT